MKWNNSEYFYIGMSQDLKLREMYHISMLKSLKSHYKLRAMYQNFGLPFFDILEYCDKDSLLEREKYYISLHKDNTMLLNHMVDRKPNHTIGIVVTSDEHDLFRSYLEVGLSRRNAMVKCFDGKDEVLLSKWKPEIKDIPKSTECCIACDGLKIIFVSLEDEQIYEKQIQKPVNAKIKMAAYRKYKQRLLERSTNYIASCC